MKKRILILTACVALCGCTVTKYQSATGEKFTRWALGNRTAVGELTVSGDTNGVRTLRLQGYSNDQVEAIAAAAKGAVEGAIASQTGK